MSGRLIHGLAPLLGVSLLLSGAGCNIIEVVETALPKPPEASSLLLAFERSFEAEVEVQAFDLTANAELSFALAGLDTDEEVRLTAVFYRETLEDLHLEPGPQVTRPDYCFHVADVEGRRPEAIFTRTTGPRGSGRLESATGPSSALERARIVPSEDACEDLAQSFEIEAITLDALEDAAFAARLTDGTVLIGTQANVIDGRAGTFWLLTDLGAQTQVEAVRILDAEERTFTSMIGEEPSWTGVQTNDGTILLSDYVPGRPNKFLWEAVLGRDDRGPKLVVTATRAYAADDTGRYKWIQKSAPGEPEEMFALSWEGNFERWTPGAVELIHDFGDFTAILSHAALLRLGPGEAIAGFNTTGTVVRYASGSVTMEPVVSVGGISGLGRHPSGAIYAGSALGALYRREEGSWSLARDFELEVALTTIIPWREGLLMTGTNGFIARAVTPSDGRERFYICRQALLHTVRLNTRLGADAIVLTGAPPAGRFEPVVSVLRPRRDSDPIPRCYSEPPAPSP